MTYRVTNLGHKCSMFSLFCNFSHGRCIADIYILHYNPNFIPSIYLYGKVLSPNYGSFSYFWELPSCLYHYYYPRTYCVWCYKPILIPKTWSLDPYSENIWDTEMNLSLCMLLNCKDSDCPPVGDPYIIQSNLMFFLPSWHIALWLSTAHLYN